MKHSFNAIIEGSYHDDWSNQHYKISTLDIYEESNLLDDEFYKYFLYGISNNYKRIKLIDLDQVLLTQKIDPLVFCDGPVLTQGSSILERPRSLFLIDGRIFLEEGMYKDKAYMDILPGILRNAGNMFSLDETLSKILV